MKFIIKEQLLQEYIVEASSYKEALQIFDEWSKVERETFRLHPDPKGELEVLHLDQ